ncbi:hypothetical protein LOD99_13012 [Oopsacas minuta]|uniref:Large ribosomal subunit protein bL21m n=1 Tax=Oopsacas minuta TaxID=111878 RepID=A0AAV7JAM1_9METZ|nr:hypothetical protein LOD99_13012 [Oopsacas minuta]
MRKLTQNILSNRIVNFKSELIFKRSVTNETEFYNRYYYPPPVVLSHPPEQGETRIMQSSSITTALSDLSLLPARDIFAVVFICGKQHKITANDFLLVTQMPDIELYTLIQLEKVLLVGSVNWSLVGTPLIRRGMVKIIASVLEHKTMEPVIVLKKKKHNYKKTNIHRGVMSLLRIEDIFVEGSFEVDFKPAIHPQDGLKSISY